MAKKIILHVNGEKHQLLVPVHQTLLTVLRDSLGLTGAKRGCDRGECGACTILLDGDPVLSCLILAVEADGAQIETIEGLAGGDSIHPLQEAFINFGAVQCGFCTPGMILAAKALLEKNLKPSENDIRKGLSGNLCRCSGYAKIIEAVKFASQGWTRSKENGKRV